MNYDIIQIIGLPGSGKTTLATEVARNLGAVHINADWARSTITSHLGFSVADRLKQAQALGQMVALISQYSKVVVDFVGPTLEARLAFATVCPKPTYIVWLDTIYESRFADTNKLFEAPTVYDLKISQYMDVDQFKTAAQRVCDLSQPDTDVYHIRFNTKAGDSPLKWRIINTRTNEEALAEAFTINGHMFSAESVEFDVPKWNVGIKGRLQWCGTHCFITRVG